jgi:hypothetical protein
MVRKRTARRPKLPTRAGSTSRWWASGARQLNLKDLARSFAPVIEDRAVKDLKVNRRNARSHDDRQVQQIAASMREFGWLVPIVVDEEDTVLAGHGRLRAAPLLNMETVPTIQVKHLTPERKRAFMLADNRLAELAEWDEDLLTIELKELSGLEFDFDFEITGFETKDLDRLEGAAAAKPAEVEVVPELDRAHPPVSSLGDLWKLGSHLLLCGNALEEASYARLMGEERAQMVFTDPPYNVKIDGSTSAAWARCITSPSRWQPGRCRRASLPAFWPRRWP